MSLHLEPIEVVDVLTDVDEPIIGAIVGRNIMDQQGSSESQLATYHPMDTNITQIPIIGEVVIGVELAGKFFYMSKFNIQNSPVENVAPNIGAIELFSEDALLYRPGKYFTGNKIGSNKLISREGDTIIQGRFGNSIRLGSNQFKDFNAEKQNYIDSPNVKIVSGIQNSGSGKFVYEESLDKEINSIYLTTKENVGFKYDNELIQSNEEPQITIQSDNIVFHGREKFNVFADNINLGGDNTQPVVLGNELVNLLNDTLLTLTNIITAYSPANPTSTPSLQTEVNNLSEKINNILSNKVNTE